MYTRRLDLHRAILILAVGALGVALLVPPLAGARAPLPRPWTGLVVGAADGDTISVMHDGRAVKVRLWGVDAPERRQDFGTVAKRFTLKAVAHKQVRVEPKAVDRYGRVVAIVRTGDVSLNEALVRAGYAWVYRRYCDERRVCRRWLQVEAKARKHKRGLWSHPTPMSPWTFRKAASTRQNERADPSGGALSGNTRSRVFHASDCRHYDCKNCTERFATRAAAERAGFRPCGNCRP